MTSDFTIITECLNSEKTIPQMLESVAVQEVWPGQWLFVDGGPEIIKDGINGFLAPVGDPHAIAKAVECILTNKQLHEELSLEAKKTGAEFSLDKQVTKFLNWYHEIIYR